MKRSEISLCMSIVKNRGGAREKAVVERPHTFEAGQWDDNHHVIHIINEPDADGHRDGCDVDLILMDIVG